MTRTDPFATKIAHALRGNNFTPVSDLDVIEIGHVFGRVTVFSRRTVCFRVHADTPFQFIADEKRGRAVFERLGTPGPYPWYECVLVGDNSRTYNTPWENLTSKVREALS